MICENCGKEHDGSYGSGRFCSKSCSISFGNKHKIRKKETNEKIANSVKQYFKQNPKEYTYTCEKCGKTFILNNKIRKDRHVYCNDCKRKVVHAKDLSELNTITDVSKRTITKILRRANVKCSICGWNESTCDIHHIIHKKDGGSDNMDNLIVVCPNCHRIIHTTDKYNTELLQQHSLDKEFSNWKDFYRFSN